MNEQCNQEKAQREPRGWELTTTAIKGGIPISLTNGILSYDADALIGWSDALCIFDQMCVCGLSDSRRGACLRISPSLLFFFFYEMMIRDDEVGTMGVTRFCRPRERGKACRRITFMYSYLETIGGEYWALFFLLFIERIWLLLRERNGDEEDRRLVLSSPLIIREERGGGTVTQPQRLDIRGNITCYRDWAKNGTRAAIATASKRELGLRLASTSKGKTI